MQIVRQFLTSGKALVSILVLVAVAHAGTIVGTVQNAQQGPLANGVFTFSLTQPATVAGTALVAPTPVSCYTDANGNVVGEPNPTAASVTSNLASGTLGAGQYFIRLTYQDGTGETVASPEVSFTMSGQGTLIVNAPATQPANATAFRVYISTTTGTETLQGSVTVSPGSWGNYSQSSPLVAGSALPGSNTTACKLRFNDELSPSFACYDTTLAAGGNTVPGFPQFWYFSGGGAGSINLGNGFPQSNVCQGVGFFWPQAIVATPANNAQQSIAGPLNTCASNGVLQVGSGCYPSLTSCYAALAPGQTCQVPPNWTDPAWTANLVMNKNDAGFLFMGAANIPMGTFSVTCSGTIAPYIRGIPAFSNRSSGAGQAVVFHYTGTGDAFTIGVAGTSCNLFHFDNFLIDIGTGTNAVGLHITQSSNGYVANVSGGGTGTGAVGILLDGNSACACDNTFININPGAGPSGSALRLKNAANLNHFVGGTLTATAAGSIGLDVQSASGNDFGMDDELNVTAISMTGTSSGNKFRGDVEASSTTAYTLGAQTVGNVIEEIFPGLNIPGTDLGTNNRITSGPAGPPGRVYQSIAGGGAQTGTAADLQLTGFTYSLTQNTLTAGKCMRVRMYWFHNQNVNNVTYKIKIGATTLPFGTGVTSNGGDNVIEGMEIELCNNAGVQNAQGYVLTKCLSVSPLVTNQTGCNNTSIGQQTSAIDFTTGPLVVQGTFNAANTETVTPVLFSVDLL